MRVDLCRTVVWKVLSRGDDARCLKAPDSRRSHFRDQVRIGTEGSIAYGGPKPRIDYGSQVSIDSDSVQLSAYLLGYALGLGWIAALADCGSRRVVGNPRSAAHSATFLINGHDEGDAS